MTSRINVAGTNLEIYPLVLGGNVFGWSADQAESFAVLDAFFEAGGNFIDTADVYSAWKPGNIGGESESIIGQWMESRKNRDQIIIATKVAKHPKRSGLSPININAAIDESLTRLKTDYVDIYYAHEDDQTVPLVDTLIAFSQLKTLGKVKHVAASNYSQSRLAESSLISEKNSLTKYIALQNEYSVVHRKDYESGLGAFLTERGINGFPYFTLARGFLSGKYRPGSEVSSIRAEGVKDFQTPAGYALIDLLEKIANQHQSTISAVSLAWLRAQPGVTAPIASARTVDQLKEIMPLLELSAEELSQISAASSDWA
jgi:aryl-alcohol dehydrogenase-like predicted oxidoreductase